MSWESLRHSWASSWAYCSWSVGADESKYESLYESRTHTSTSGKEHGWIAFLPPRHFSFPLEFYGFTTSWYCTGLLVWVYWFLLCLIDSFGWFPPLDIYLNKSSINLQQFMASLSSATRIFHTPFLLLLVPRRLVRKVRLMVWATSGVHWNSHQIHGNDDHFNGGRC